MSHQQHDPYCVERTVSTNREIPVQGICNGFIFPACELKLFTVAQHYRTDILLSISIRAYFTGTTTQTNLPFSSTPSAHPLVHHLTLQYLRPPWLIYSLDHVCICLFTKFSVILITCQSVSTSHAPFIHPIYNPLFLAPILSCLLLLHSPTHPDTCISYVAHFHCIFLTAVLLFVAVWC